MRKPSARKLARINPKFSREKIFGFTPKNILNEFRKWLSSVSSARLYRTQTGEAVVKCIWDNGRQGIYMVEQGIRGPEFRYSGFFNSNFSHREIFGKTKLRRKGLATRALKSFLAMQRKIGNNRVDLTITTKSTLLFLLENGFEVNYSSLSNYRKKRVEKLLERLKTDPDSVPENLPLSIYVRKNLLRKKKKA